MSEWSYVGAAYGLTWITLAGYALYLFKRVRQAERLHDEAHRQMEVDR